MMGELNLRVFWKTIIINTATSARAIREKWGASSCAEMGGKEWIVSHHLSMLLLMLIVMLATIYTYTGGAHNFTTTAAATTADAVAASKKLSSSWNDVKGAEEICESRTSFPSEVVVNANSFDCFMVAQFESFDSFQSLPQMPPSMTEWAARNQREASSFHILKREATPDFGGMWRSRGDGSDLRNTKNKDGVSPSRKRSVPFWLKHSRVLQPT